MKKNSLTAMICLTIAVVACFTGVAIKAILPYAFAENEQVSTPVIPDETPAPAPKPSLHPNLSLKQEIPGGQLLLAAHSNQNFLLVHTLESSSGIISLSANMEVEATLPLPFPLDYAAQSDGELILSEKGENGDRIFGVANDGTARWSSPVYPNEKTLYLEHFYDGDAALFFSEGEAGKRLIFRFFDDGEMICERYSTLIYDVKIVKIYRIGNVFTVFYGYNSPFSSGGGYINFSLNLLAASPVYIERSDQYELLDVIPSGESFALLCSGVTGAFIMQLDQNLNRSEKFDLTDFTVNSGKLSFDGKNYFVFLGGADGGIMYKVNDSFDDLTELPAYKNALSVKDELNTGSALTHLCQSKTGYFLAFTDNPVTKPVSDECEISFLLLGKSVTAVFGTINSENAQNIYAATLN